MKALISAFALLSFVAASTIPFVAQAQAQDRDAEADAQEGQEVA